MSHYRNIRSFISPIYIFIVLLVLSIFSFNSIAEKMSAICLLVLIHTKYLPYQTKDTNGSSLTPSLSLQFSFFYTGSILQLHKNEPVSITSNTTLFGLHIVFHCEQAITAE